MPNSNLNEAVTWSILTLSSAQFSSLGSSISSRFRIILRPKATQIYLAWEKGCDPRKCPNASCVAIGATCHFFTKISLGFSLVAQQTMTRWNSPLIGIRAVSRLLEVINSDFIQTYIPFLPFNSGLKKNYPKQTLTQTHLSLNRQKMVHDSLLGTQLLPIRHRVLTKFHLKNEAADVDVGDTLRPSSRVQQRYFGRGIPGEGNDAAKAIYPTSCRTRCRHARWHVLLGAYEWIQQWQWILWWTKRLRNRREDDVEGWWRYGFEEQVRPRVQTLLLRRWEWRVRLRRREEGESCEDDAWVAFSRPRDHSAAFVYCRGGLALPGDDHAADHGYWDWDWDWDWDGARDDHNWARQPQK